MKTAAAVLDPNEGLLVEQTGYEREAAKNELLDLAVKADGGLDRWNKVKAIKVAASIRARSGLSRVRETF